MGIYATIYNCNNDSDNPDDYCAGQWCTLTSDWSICWGNRCPKHKDLDKFFISQVKHVNLKSWCENTLKLSLPHSDGSMQHLNAHVKIIDISSIRNRHGKDVTIVKCQLSTSTEPTNSITTLLTNNRNLCERNSIWYTCFGNSSGDVPSVEFKDQDVILTLPANEMHNVEPYDQPCVGQLKPHLRYDYHKIRVVRFDDL